MSSQPHFEPPLNLAPAPPSRYKILHFSVDGESAHGSNLKNIAKQQGEKEEICVHSLFFPKNVRELCLLEDAAHIQSKPSPSLSMSSHVSQSTLGTLPMNTQ
ncbi:hypothetical protein STEG23_005697, partial [Scotinomys teguina]